eukprot:jgi/Astpho2/7353/e_gw1.00114.263.1_t
MARQVFWRSGHAPKGSDQDSCRAGHSVPRLPVCPPRLHERLGEQIVQGRRTETQELLSPHLHLRQEPSRNVFPCRLDILAGGQYFQLHLHSTSPPTALCELLWYCLEHIPFLCQQ